MKRMMMTTTALGILLSAPAMAQTADAPQMGMESDLFSSGLETGDIYGTDLIGKRLYVSETEFEEGYMATAEDRAEWDDVGEIGDLIISQDGEVQSVILDIGGFLGLGERTVAVNMEELNFIREDGMMNDMFIAISGTREMLESAPEFIRDDAMDVNATAETPMADDTTAGALPATRPALMVDGYKDMEPEALTAEALEGASVYSVNDEDIGNVSQLILDGGGQITEAVVDVGGFLGLGAKAVALTMDEMQIVRSDAGDDVRVYIDTTKEVLESRPEYTQ